MYCVKIGELEVVGYQMDKRKRDARITFNDVSTRLDIAGRALMRYGELEE
jgi:hypothetical protein